MKLKWTTGRETGHILIFQTTRSVLSHPQGTSQALRPTPSAPLSTALVGLLFLPLSVLSATLTL